MPTTLENNWREQTRNSSKALKKNSPKTNSVTAFGLFYVMATWCARRASSCFPVESCSIVVALPPHTRQSRRPAQLWLGSVPSCGSSGSRRAFWPKHPTQASFQSGDISHSDLALWDKTWERNWDAFPKMCLLQRSSKSHRCVTVHPSHARRRGAKPGWFSFFKE